MLSSFSATLKPALLGAVWILASCDEGPKGAARETGPSAGQPVAQAQGLKQRQIEFLNRIRQADPQSRTVDRALLNEQNELGLVLDRTVDMEKIPQLMKTMLTQMAAEFPDEDLTVLAYAPSDPPRKIGTAKLNSRTRDMTYTPEE